MIKKRQKAKENEKEKEKKTGKLKLKEWIGVRKAVYGRRVGEGDEARDEGAICNDRL
jgi:hypothetical protein